MSQNPYERFQLRKTLLYALPSVHGAKGTDMNVFPYTYRPGLGRPFTSFSFLEVGAICLLLSRKDIHEYKVTSETTRKSVCLIEP